MRAGRGGARTEAMSSRSDTDDNAKVGFLYSVSSSSSTWANTFASTTSGSMLVVAMDSGELQTSFSAR